MGEVSVGLSMSLDGFIAGPNDGPDSPFGDGGERLFAWYSAGDTDYELPGTEMVFRVSPQSAELLREADTTAAWVYEVVPAKVLGFGKGEPFSQTLWRF
jgi:hypothetical protein